MKKYFIYAAMSALGISALAGPEPYQAINTNEASSIVEILSHSGQFDPTTAMSLLDEGFLPEGLPVSSELTAGIISYATELLGRPYLRGGKTPSGFDCSGFTSHVFGKFGLSLSPSSSTQFTQGEEISIGEARPGDLIFFSGRRVSKTNIGHVGMIVDVVPSTGQVKFIHSASNGGVRYDVYPDDPYYNTRYIGIRRVLD